MNQFKGLLLLIPFLLFSEIQFDGLVDKDEWQNAVRYSIDVETRPSYNTQAEHQTDAYVMHDEFYLYVGFKVYGNKEFIRAQVRSRDGIFYTNDHVIFGLDTYGDGRYFIGFGANPYGSILDYKEGPIGEPERSYNVEFEAEAQFTDYGYDVELKIPFSSINYEDTDIKRWKVAFYRKLYNKGVESGYLSHKVIAGKGCLICQSPYFYELTDISQKSKKRLIPSLTANSRSFRDDSGAMVTDKVDPEISLNGIYEVNDNTFEFTINPDFSQVEADESQIDVNSTTALRYPERRIFFNEGADFLRTDLSAVYTRSINSPDYALKVFNRGDTHSYYFLDAEDQSTPLIVPGNMRSYSALLGKSHANIFSYNYNRDNGQYLSFLATNREYEEGGYGRNYVSRGLFILDDKHAFRFELAQSDTEEPISDLITTTAETDKYTYRLDGESFSGYGGLVAFSRSTENWFTYFQRATKSPEFRTDLGFTTENNWIKDDLWQRYEYRGTGLVRSANARFNASVSHNYDNQLLQQEYGISFNLDLANQMEFGFGYENNVKVMFEEYNFKNFSDYNFNATYSPSGNFYFRLGYSAGEGIARNIDTPSIGDRENYNLSTRYQFTDEFNVRLQYRYNSLSDQITKEDYFAGYVTSVRATYQFNKDSFIRVVHEYNDFNNDSYTQALFQWQPDSATIFYIGGTINQEDIQGTWVREGSQIYMKLQYLFNFD